MWMAKVMRKGKMCWKGKSRSLYGKPRARISFGKLRSGSSLALRRNSSSAWPGKQLGETERVVKNDVYPNQPENILILEKKGDITFSVILSLLIASKSDCPISNRFATMAVNFRT